MLVKIVDHKDEPVYVNPVYVRMVRAKKSHVEVYVTTGAGSATGVIKTKARLGEVVEALNIGMVDLDNVPPPGDDASGDGDTAGFSAALT